MAAPPPLAHHDAGAELPAGSRRVLPGWDLEETLARAKEVEAVLRGGGCRRFLADMYGDAPNQWQDGLAGVNRLRMIVNAFTRMRMVDRHGRLDFACKGPPGETAAVPGALVRAPLEPAGGVPGRVRSLVGAGALRDRPLGVPGLRLRLGRIAVRGAPGWTRRIGARVLLLSPRRAHRAVAGSSIPPLCMPPSRGRRHLCRGIGAHSLDPAPLCAFLSWETPSWLDSRCPCSNAPTRGKAHKGATAGASPEGGTA